ncbi:MAG: DUF4160 domain-containing protein [Cyclobacteriaceae bacterium]|nr:DUF4160 domain-containing protein [Cyclobacteriaceae bacterium]
MPVISRFYGILVKMYFGDHAPPHFHAEYGEFSAVISINDFGMLQGYLPPKALALVAEWASVHQQELLDNWESLSERGDGSFKKIAPLE